ncbi:chromosome segregation protein SMC [Niveispirillum lacus]|uniref:Chromosome partition protein Smc n=1 Tax=Niveispirillum lacus TaxID=1981099 RepID=A0A255Z4N0_9PROT|nr:chromosome segregation protein SMC [Niveispirillum lacus]OYQ36477.1 chromosome segregation protein SMC [Niveispirillum lacus]
MQFTKLRLSGFKSFVDQTELLIEPGMTGVVGPNGCGKSNLLEALRWAMGETSAKRMRGEDMDDVIFGGTATRPARNICEVTMVLGNKARTAPPPFTDAEELEITRRLERGSGSDYRINGKLVRARDVQILFADHSSGANSPSMVSQGRVGALINAKPADRRQLLEEAAGISGLHARRHEAELRLRAAETNLTRLEDVLAAMDGQLQGLRKQARQAQRYRQVQDHIRRAEAQLLHQRWAEANRLLDRARDGHATADQAVRDQMLAVGSTVTARDQAAEALPALRQEDAAAGAALQRLLVAREQLDAEEARVKEAHGAMQRRLAQLATDLARERALAADADNAAARLAEERASLLDAQAEEAMELEAAEEALLTARDAMEAAERDLSRVLEQAASEEAARTATANRLRDAQARLSTLEKRLSEQAAQLTALDATIGDDDALQVAAEALILAEQRLDLAREAAEQAEMAKQEADSALEQARSDGQATIAEARSILSQAEARETQLRAERDGLRALLNLEEEDLFPPLIDAVAVAAGYEQALAAALGDDLTAPLDEAAARHWRALPPLDATTPLPAGVEPLSTQVKAPAEMARCLSHIGLVPDAATARRLAPTLAAGQILVSRDGGAWRWDGLTTTPGAPTAAAIRLTQRNRLAEIELALDRADADLSAARRAHAEASEAADAAVLSARRAQEATQAGDRQARDAVRHAFTAVDQARHAQSRLISEAAAARSKRDALAQALEVLTSDKAEAAYLVADAQAALDALPDPTLSRMAVADARGLLAEQRGHLSGTQGAVDRVKRDAEQRRRRLSSLEAEQLSWKARVEGAASRLSELTERAEEGQAELEALTERPLEIAAERETLRGHIATAERRRRQTGDALAEAETALSQAEQAVRKAESALADAREARAHAEAAVAQSLNALAGLVERIREKLDCEPGEVLAAAGIDPDDEMPPPSQLEQRLSRLLEDRERIGPVNLRAEVELAEMEAETAKLTTERDDLTAAIARLRQGIGAINREAREKLLASFDLVDGHFQRLFTKLFGGGVAHLKLTESDDPLDAGLEIYASPPGKKLQVLSLLSGGEQALTALSLLFAVFLCNPAPICVLDEVDAPLDEANVGRFCDMVEEMAASGATRFLIVTHHRLTMARMHRLFGVTMMERGVSQLVSVDLEKAAEMVDA